LFVFTIIPLLVYGTILGERAGPFFDPSIEISFYVMMAGIEAAFLFFLFRMIREFLNKEQKKSFPILSIVLMFFVLSGMRKFLPSELPYYWWFEFALILLQGGVLAVAQKHLNAFWALEREKLAESN
jgi:protein-S-isoprenylcysteine O-methyltransferase Ste14